MKDNKTAMIIIGSLIAIVVSIFLVYSNIIEYNIRFMQLPEVNASINCNENHIANMMLEEFGPSRLSNFRLTCNILSGDWFESKSYMICAFRKMVDTSDVCGTLVQMGQYCNDTLRANWLCYKTEVSCRCG